MRFRTLLENDINFNKKTDSITESRPSVSGCPGLPVSATMAGRASTLGSRLTATDRCLGHLTPMVKGTRRWGDLQSRAAPKVQTSLINKRSFRLSEWR